MKIFYRRPLSLILCIMLGAFSLFAKIGQNSRYFLWVIALIILALSLFKLGNGKFSSPLFRTCIIAFLIASIFSHFYFNLYFKAYERFEGEVSLSGTVTEISTNEYYTSLSIKTSDVNSSVLSRYKLIARVDTEKLADFPKIKVGSKLYLEGKISDFNDKNSSFDANEYYLSKGFSAKITDIQSIKIQGEEKKPLAFYFNEARARASDFIIKNSNEEAGGLLVALLLGEKSHLSPSISLDFERIGISHILALSGLHLAILALGFGKLLSIFGFGKKASTLSTIIFTVCYMALTGFSISVVRAGIMLIIASLLYLFANASDSLTNLSISVFLIVLVSPFSIFDISLLLSAFATLGIVALADLPKNYEQKRRGIKDKIINSLLISLFALSATFLISVLSFGEISVISPISTLVFSFIVEIFLYFGTFFLIFGGIIPLGNIIIFFGNFIKELARSFSEMKYVCTSTNYVSIKALAFVFTVVFFLFLILDVKNKRLGVTLISSFMCLILVSGVFLTVFSENKDRFTYLACETGDALLLTNGGELSLIESKTYTPGARYEALDFLREEKLTRLDNYVITSYNTKMPEAIYELLSDVKISKLYLPLPKTAFEEDIYNKLVTLIAGFGANFVCYQNNSELTFNGFSISAKYRNEKLFLFEIDMGNKKCTYASSGILDSEAKNLALYEIHESDIAIFARFGKKYTRYSFVYEFQKPKLIIASSAGMNISEYTLNYYKNSGAEVYLTPERYDFIR